MIKDINKGSFGLSGILRSDWPRRAEHCQAEGKVSSPQSDVCDGTRRPHAAGLSIAPLLTIAEVAQHFRMSERSVRRRIKDGTIRKIHQPGRLVRISLDELNRIAKD